MSIANVAHTVEPQRRQLLHRLIMGLGHRKDCGIGWLEGFRRSVIGSDTAKGSDGLADRGELFLDLRRRRLENHIASLFAALSAATL
jgi:hypothetical protein